MIRINKAISHKIAILSHLLAKGRISTEFRSERKLYALKNWISTSETNVIVIASAVLRPDLSAQLKTPRLTSADQSPPTTIRVTTGRVKIPVRGFRGRRRIRSGSCGSTERASAGRPPGGG